MSEPPTRPRLGHRIGDEQRHACADELADAFMTGRLTREEFESRVDQSLSAATDVDLALLTHDLRTKPAALPARRPSAPVVSLTPVAVVKVVAFEVVLAVIAFAIALGVGSADWPLIAIFLWAFGSAAGAAAALLAKPKSPPAD